MLIGEFARRSGVSARMLRYYEEQGVLTPSRTSAGYRMYSSDDLEIIKRITLLNRAGFSLETIRHVLECRLPGDHAEDYDGVEICDALRERIRHKIDEVNARIQELEHSRALLLSYFGNTDP